jgi:hypothetical protein
VSGHTSEKRWDDTNVNGKNYTGISERASNEVRELIARLLQIEEAYQQMQEIYTYAGGTSELLAELLFKEDIAGRDSPDNVVSTEEIAKATDLVSAMTAAHQIYQASNNIVVTQSDRLTEMRRMV